MIFRALLRLLLGLLLLQGAVPVRAWPDVPRIDGPCGLQFPTDHGPHPEHIVEWWYFTGNLTADRGRPFGFELTFFRTRLSADREQTRSGPVSDWRTDQVWAAHFALSDIENRGFHQSERVMRGAKGLAGAEPRDGAWHFNVRDWRMVIGPQVQTLRARTKDMELALELIPTKGPILHGDEGYSRKGSRPTSASCYVSFPRLQAGGQIRLGEATFGVTGQAWMDHEFSSALLEEDMVGWDWFSLQLSDQTEVMFFVLRTVDGGRHPASAGTFITRAGRTMAISSSSTSVEVLDTWQSPETGIVYPSGWRLSMEDIRFEAVVRPRMKNQEMRTESTTGRIYWEGSVSVQGRRGQDSVNGTGYVELTGYGKPFGPLGDTEGP